MNQKNEKRATHTIQAYIPTVADSAEFDPDHNLFDYMTVKVIESVSGKQFNLPFRLKFVDANQLILKEIEVIEKNGVILTQKVQVTYLFPVTCTLTDADGATGSFVVTTEEIRQLIDAADTAADGAIELTFPLGPGPLSFER